MCPRNYYHRTFDERKIDVFVDFAKQMIFGNKVLEIDHLELILSWMFL